MTLLEILSLVATVIGLGAFAAAFTILYRSYARSAILQTESGKRDIELIDKALNERDEKVKRKKERAKKIKNALFIAFIVIMIPAFFVSLLNKISGGKPIFGKNFIVVATGSMSEKHEVNGYLNENNLNDQFNQYDIIIIERVKSASELKKYDVIAFKNDKGVNIIHRIIGVSGNKYITRGDANNADDSYQPGFNDVLGVYRGARIGAIGAFIMFLQSYSGIMTILALVYCMFMFDGVYKKIETCEETRTKILLEAIEGEENALTEKAMTAEFSETIYYKGFAYNFNEKGFIDKVELTESKTDDEDVLVKVVDDGESVATEEIKIQTRKDDNGKPE